MEKVEKKITQGVNCMHLLRILGLNDLSSKVFISAGGFTITCANISDHFCYFIEV